jgi:hypothetical protein
MTALNHQAMALVAENLVRGAAPAPKIRSSSQLQRASRSPLRATIQNRTNAILLNGKEEKIFALSKTDGRVIFDVIEKHGTALTVT